MDQIGVRKQDGGGKGKREVPRKTETEETNHRRRKARGAVKEDMRDERKTRKI